MATHETTREALRGRLDILETELTEKKADLTAMQQSRVEMQSKMKVEGNDGCMFDDGCGSHRVELTRVLFL